MVMEWEKKLGLNNHGRPIHGDSPYNHLAIYCGTIFSLIQSRDDLQKELDQIFYIDALQFHRAAFGG